MSNNLNVSGSYLKLHTFSDEKDQIVKGKSEFFKDQRFIDISMFSRGVTNDGRKWIADDGYVNLFDYNGDRKKIRRIGIDKDNDGIADTYMRVRTLQNGKIKEHNSKYNTEYVEQKLSKYMAINDPQKKQNKLDKLKKKLIKAGISEDAIDKKLYPQKQTVHAFSEKKAKIEPAYSDTVNKDRMDKNADEPQLLDKSFKDMTMDEKLKQADNMLAMDRKNKSDARRLLLDPNLQDYYKRNPQILAIVARIAS